MTAMLAALAAPAAATKLDLSADVELKAANYSDLIYGKARNSQGLFIENTSLGFVIKDIRLEKAPQSTMEVGIILQSAGGGSSTAAVTAPQFADAAARLPATGGDPYIRDAYVRVNNFVHSGVNAFFGRQEYTLGQGITLASDNLGLPGARIEANNIYHGLKADVFYFRPFADERYYNLYGGAVQYPANEGTWQMYHFWQHDAGAGSDMTFNATSKTKKYTGLRYVMSQKHLSFDGEAAVQRGTAELAAGGKGTYEGHAFMMKGSWMQDIGFFGRSKIRMAYGRSSGNAGGASGTNSAFFPAFGGKYNGIERSGYGEIAGASLYDIIKTSATANGLPDGVSGLNIINVGADLPYKQLLLTADIYKFRATRNTSGGSLQIASEWDLKAAYPLGDNLRLTAVYATFTPMGVYSKTSETKLIYTAVSAKF